MCQWSRLPELNRRPTAYKAAALPAELRRRTEHITRTFFSKSHRILLETLCAVNFSFDNCIQKPKLHLLITIKPKNMQRPSADPSTPESPREYTQRSWWYVEKAFELFKRGTQVWINAQKGDNFLCTVWEVGSAGSQIELTKDQLDSYCKPDRRNLGVVSLARAKEIEEEKKVMRKDDSYIRVQNVRAEARRVISADLKAQSAGRHYGNVMV